MPGGVNGVEKMYLAVDREGAVAISDIGVCWVYENELSAKALAETTLEIEPAQLVAKIEDDDAVTQVAYYFGYPAEVINSVLGAERTYRKNEFRQLLRANGLI
jgi:hypothetical protein